MKTLFFLFLTNLFLYGEFIKSENIVEDNIHNLMWQDNIEATYEESRVMAYTACDELVLNGYIDWYLPTLKQLQTLIDQKKELNHLQDAFAFLKEGGYWSNTPNIINKEQYWYVDFKSGKVSLEDKNQLLHVRCVREIK